MRSSSLVTGAWIGALTSLPVAALNWLAFRAADLPFVPFHLFDWLARVLPGNVVTFGIDLMVGLIQGFQLGPTAATAKAAEQILALFQFILIGLAFGVILAALTRSRPQRLVNSGLRGGAVLAGAFLLVEIMLGLSPSSLAPVVVWLLVLSLAWGAALGWLLLQAGPAMAPAPESPLSRRGFVTAVGGGAIGISLGAWGLASLLQAEAPAPTGTAALPVPEIVLPPPEAPSAEVLAARIQPAPGTREELTSNAEFYRIDINTSPPEVNGETWRLELGGLVDNPLSLSRADLMAMPMVTQTLTLSCISNRLGGDLISTSNWTGVPLQHVLQLAGLRPEAKELYIEAADGFYESVGTKDLQDPRTLLVLAMNGEPLPVEHGFPLRIYIPNRYGMKQPKWIVRMTAIDREGAGYWVDRGWSETAYVNTTSVIDTVAVEAADSNTGTIPVGGIAWSGERGISRVEVQVDDGPWTEADLRTPPLSSLTWVQWRLDWPQQAGRHTFRVRAYDASGGLQVLSPRGVRPDGATGVHEVTVTV
jgi:DMSO/TMAO reductase YedYZ molybdopterin-dependent catalytic subunit